MAEISVVIPVYNLKIYIADMLISLMSQTFDDFEAVIIDDGSTDGSGELIRELVDGDSRFLYCRQANSGVSAARNRGMDMASGKYVVFFDGDDFIPEDSLEAMLNAIKENDCDMAVGIMETFSDGRLTVNAPTYRLAQKKVISPMDPDFINTWSPCNKIFRLDFLRDNGIRFIDVRVAEDGHFLYQVLSVIERICGCKKTVYHYMRRSFWEGDISASKNVDIQYLEDRMRVYEDMLMMVDCIFRDNDTGKTEYRDRLVTRFIKGGMIQAFYKRIWRCDARLESRLGECLAFYRKKISEKAWQQICRDEWEIQPEARILQRNHSYREQILKEPVITVGISDRINGKALETTLTGLYAQEFPSFEILMCGDAQENDVVMKFNKGNIRFVNYSRMNLSNIASNALGEYVCYIDVPVIISTHGFKNMIGLFSSKSNPDFVSAYARRFIVQNERVVFDGKYRLECIDAAFGFGDNTKRIIENCFDSVFSNKLFKKTALLSDNYDYGEKVPVFYEKMNFAKTRKELWGISISDEELMMRAGVEKNRRIVKRAAARNRILERFAGRGIKKTLRNILK